MPELLKEENFGEDKKAIAKKICQKLQSEDRKVRKQAYSEMENFLSNKEVEFTKEDLRNIFCETHVYILNGLRDKSETVRNQAICFLNYLIIEKLPINDFYLTYVSPVFVERIGGVELIEESEEIRLQLVYLLQAIIIKYSNTTQLKPFLSDFVIILEQTVKDKYPAIKEISCQVIVNLASALPRDFHMEAEQLIKPVLSCLGHQRYKVRLGAIRAVGEIIMHSTYKALYESVVPLAERLFDQIPTVRRTVAEVAARWLLEYRDRYSFFHVILPLLLTGLNDEIEETRILSETLWDRVGLQFQQENEKDLKDEIDYLTSPPKYYPTTIKRPNLGCRVLVKRNVSKLIDPISRELTSWQEHVKVRCSQLLCVLVLHAEDGITQNMQNLLSVMYSTAKDDDSRVVDNIIQASKLLGHFTRYQTWCKFIIPAIEDGPHYGHLTVLAGLIEGSPKEYIKEHVNEICKLLSDDYMCHSRKGKYQLKMAKCVEVLCEKHNDGVINSTGYYLFKIIVTLMSLRAIDVEAETTSQLFEYLQLALNLNDTKAVWKLYSSELLKQTKFTPKIWTLVNDEACIFLTVLSESEEAFVDNLDIIGDVLVELLDDENDTELRLKTFNVLCNVFEKNADIFKKSSNSVPFFEKLITEGITPSLIWRAGSIAEAMRTMAALCLKHALKITPGVNQFSSENYLIEIRNQLVPLLISLLEDGSHRSRQFSIECLLLLKTNCSKEGLWRTEDLVQIYPEILKRLDDPVETVRMCALENIGLLIENCPDQFKHNHFKIHHDLIIDTLLTHFDDDDVHVQETVSDVLKILATVNATELLDRIKKHKPLLRNKNGCDDILQFLHALN